MVLSSDPVTNLFFEIGDHTTELTFIVCSLENLAE